MCVKCVMCVMCVMCVQEVDIDELVTSLHLDMKTRLQLRKHRQQAIKELNTNSISNSDSRMSSITSQNYFQGSVDIGNMTLEGPAHGNAALYIFKLLYFTILQLN